MKNYAKIIFFVSAIVICGIISSCKTTDNYHRTIYRTNQQPAVASATIKDAAEFKVKPIDFSAINPTYLGYANANEWKADLESVPQAFADALLQLDEEAKTIASDTPPPKYKVIMLKENEPISSGIIVSVIVKSITQKWTYGSKNPDEFLCNVTFTDASNKQVLFSSIVTVTSKQATLYIGGNRGLFPVGPGMSFSSRLKAAAYNMAQVLTTIMRQGKIEPADKFYHDLS
jgi:hypothetical protein